MENKKNNFSEKKNTTPREGPTENEQPELLKNVLNVLYPNIALEKHS